MPSRSFRTAVVTTFSVLTAVGLLLFLLLVATAPAAEKLRTVGERLDYMNSVLDAIEQGVALSLETTQGRDMSVELGALHEAVVNGSASLELAVARTYMSGQLTEQLRWSGVQALNVADIDVDALTDRATLLAASTVSLDGLNILAEQLAQFRADQAEFEQAKAYLDRLSREVVTTLREDRREQQADAIYVATNQVLQLVTSKGVEQLHGVFAQINKLEAVQPSLPRALQVKSRQLVNVAYELNARRRSMAEAVNTMNVTGLRDALADMDRHNKVDYHYTQTAINDARILLNIFTLLLLGLLTFFGLRLQRSNKALNESHDDLELRVQERTADLARANDDLQESQVQLVQAEKMSSLGQLVAGVMHEINTPLLYVQNNTTLSAESVADVSTYVRATLPMLQAEDDRQLQQNVQRFVQSAAQFNADEIVENLDEVASLADDSLDGLAQISELVQSLKDFSRLDRVADDKFDVREGIEKTLVITRNLLKQGVEVDLQMQAVPEIYCSPSRLNQVFINLVTNAVQAMEGQGTLTITVAPIVSSSGESVEIVFADTGCGIPEEHLNKIMDPFFTTKPVGQGTGLGLSIVQQIVAQHGGIILIDSKVGVGTRISLSFPLEKPPLLEPLDNDEEAA